MKCRVIGSDVDSQKDARLVEDGFKEWWRQNWSARGVLVYDPSSRCRILLRRGGTRLPGDTSDPDTVNVVLSVTIKGPRDDVFIQKEDSETLDPRHHHTIEAYLKLAEFVTQHQ